MHEWYGDKLMVIRNKKNAYDFFSNCLEKFLETSEVTTWVTQKFIRGFMLLYCFRLKMASKNAFSGHPSSDYRGFQKLF